MKIVIVGGGNVGSMISKSLSEEGRDVVVVERDAESAARIESDQDVSVIRGDGTRPGILKEAGVAEGGGVDCVIACTNHDDANLMVCWLARRAGVQRVLSRVRNLEFTDTPDWARELGIDVMVSPERALSREIMTLLTVNAAVHSLEIFGGHAGSFAFRVEEDSPVCGMSLREVGMKYPKLGAIMAYVERDDVGFVPSGDWVARENDLCFMITLNERISRVQSLFDQKRSKRLSKVIIVGGGKLGANLAHRLTEHAVVPEVILIDKDTAKCERLAQEYENVTVINGDGLDKKLLLSLGIEHADGLVTATDSDETNVIVASLAKVLRCRKTIAVVHSNVYDDLDGILPVDVFLNPIVTMASMFLRHVRYPNTAGILSLIDRIGAEMLEFELKSDSPVINRRIMDLKLPHGILIATVKRGDSYLIPAGADTLAEGDLISVFAMSDLMPVAMRLFKVN